MEGGSIHTAALPTGEPEITAERSYRVKGVQGGCILLILLVLVAHMAGLLNGFVNYDDPIFITENPQVQKGMTVEGVKYALFGTDEGYLHPIPTLSFMVDSQIAGMNAKWFHFVNLVIHAANVILLFLLLAKLTGNVLASGLVAALFAVHPLNVESVAWVSERKGLLNALFFLFSIWLYVDFVKTRQSRYFIASLISFLASLLCKPISVTLPFILILLDYWPLGRLGAMEFRNLKAIKEKFLPLLQEKLPYCVLALFIAGLTYSAQNRIGDLKTAIVPPGTTRLAVIAESYVDYLRMAFVPVNPIPFYPPGPVTHGIAIGLVCGIVLLLLIALRRMRPLVFGACWFTIMLLPVINIIPFGVARIADRFAYLPLIGLFVALVFGSFSLKRITQHVVTAAIVVAVLGSVFLTQKETPRWHDSISLFKYTLQVCPDNYIALNNLSWELIKTNAPSQKLDPALITMAEKACDLTGFTNRYVLDTLYTAYVKNGDLRKADKILAMEMSLALENKQSHLVLQLMDEREKLWAPNEQSAQTNKP